MEVHIYSQMTERWDCKILAILEFPNRIDEDPLRVGGPQGVCWGSLDMFEINMIVLNMSNIVTRYQTQTVELKLMIELITEDWSY